MIELTAQQLAAHYMAATAQLLTGEPGREMDLERTVHLCIGAPKSRCRNDGIRRSRLQRAQNRGGAARFSSGCPSAITHGRQPPRVG